MVSDKLFEQFEIRGCRFRNRIWVPPMCQYMAEQGSPNEWHLPHYAGLSHSAGVVIVEATAVSDIGRVTPQDLVLDSDRSLPAYRALATAIRARGSVPGIQLSHAGRKGSRTRPWEGDVALLPSDGGWKTVAPSAISFGAGYATPVAMSITAIEQVIDEFARAGELACRAGFRFIEVHGGHGRLVHSFLSPVSNHRDDSFGGDLANRAGFACRLARRLREVIGSEVVLAFRLSCVDWCDGGLTLEDSVQIATWLQDEGVDLIDCSSGGIARPLAKQTAPGYQVRFATEIRRRTGLATAAVGLIQSLDSAAEILERGQADVVLLGRHLMLDPFSLMRLAADRGVMDLVPLPYRRAASQIPKSTTDHVPEL